MAWRPGPWTRLGRQRQRVEALDASARRRKRGLLRSARRNLDRVRRAARTPAGLGCAFGAGYLIEPLLSSKGGAAAGKARPVFDRLRAAVPALLAAFRFVRSMHDAPASMPGDTARDEVPANAADDAAARTQ